MKKRIRITLDYFMITIVLALLVFFQLPYFKVALIAVLILGYSRLVGENGILKFDHSVNLKTTLVIAFSMASIILMAIYFVVRPALELVTNELHQIGTFSNLRGNLKLLVIGIGMGWILGGFAEEIVFRGFLLKKISDQLPGKIGQVVAVAITSIIFGYLHAYQGFVGQLLAGIIGITLGSIFIMNEGRIWLNILIHGFINTISMVIVYLGIS